MRVIPFCKYDQNVTKHSSRRPNHPCSSCKLVQKVSVSVSVCVCVREIERERERRGGQIKGTVKMDIFRNGLICIE